MSRIVFTIAFIVFLFFASVVSLHALQSLASLTAYQLALVAAMVTLCLYGAETARFHMSDYE